MKFEILRGNIVNVPADAVVLPANSQLKEGSGASRAIFEAAGRKELTNACKQIGHCDIGTAVPTLAFRLNAKYIIHACVPRWGDGNHDEYALLSSAYFSSMQVANVMECETIAFPLLASGNNGFDKELAFKIAAESITAFEGKKLKKAMLVVFDVNTEYIARSQGYNVSAVPEKENRKKKTASEAENNIALDICKKGIEWIKQPEVAKNILTVGLDIAAVVVGTKSKTAGKALREVKEILK